MPYIGRDLNRGNYLKLDDISSSFNGSTKTFNLTVGGSAFTPGSAFSILVSVGGVIQEPESAYQVNNSEITFANAPTAQDGFFCTALAAPIGVGVPGNGTVNGAQIAKPFNYDGFFYLNDGTNRVGINSSSPSETLDIIGNTKISGILTATTFSGPTVNTSGISTFYDLRVSNNLTVEGTTTTLDTNLIGVDRIEVGADSNTVVGVAITQSGTADILRLYDGSTEVVKFNQYGNLTITSGNPVYASTNSSSSVTTTLFSNSAGQGVVQTNSGHDLIFGTGSVEKVRIMSGGSIGIRTTTGSNTVNIGGAAGLGVKFHNFTSGNSSYITVESGDKIQSNVGGTGYFTWVTGSSEKFRIASNGRVGILTVTPEARLDVYDTSGLGILSRSAATQATDTNKALKVRNNSTTDTFNVSYKGQGYFAGKVGIGTNNPAQQLAGASDLVIGNIGEADSGMTFVSATNGQSLIHFSDATSGNARYDGFIGYEQTARALKFGTAQTERLRIKSDGNIIPGTNNATSIGDGTTNFNSIWASTRFRGNDNVKLVLGNSQNLVIRHDGSNNIIGSPVADDLHIKSGTLDNDNQLIAAFKHSNASVGIGTNDPDQKLHVYNGAGNVTSFVEAIAGDAVLDISNTGNGNFSGINFTRQRSTGSVIGGSIFMPSNTSNNEAFLYIQAQSASANAGVTGTLSDNNGVRLKLHGDDGIFSIETGSSEKLRITADGKVGINENPGTAQFEVKSAQLGGTAGNTQEVVRLYSPDVTNTTSYRFTNYRVSNGTSHSSSELRFRRHVDVTDMGYFGLGDSYVSIGYGTAEKLRIASDGHVAIGGYGDPGSILDVRENKDGAETQIRLFNTDNGDTTTQTAALYLSPDSRGTALTGIRAIKENASFATNAGRDISLTLNTVQNNAQVEAIRINSNGEFIMSDSSTKTFIDLETTGNNTRAIMSLKGKTSGGGDVHLIMGGYGDTNRGEIFTYTNHDLGFATNNAAAQFKCKTNGNFEIVNGDLVVASGHGIDFSATANSAGTSTSELLDDYEEGSCVPTQINGSFTPSSADGKYTKVGRLVTWMMHINFDSTASNNHLKIGNLPFTAGSGRSGTAIVRYSNDDEAFKIAWHVDALNATAVAYYLDGGALVPSNAVSQKRFDLTFVYEAT